MVDVCRYLVAKVTGTASNLHVEAAIDLCFTFMSDQKCLSSIDNSFPIQITKQDVKFRCGASERTTLEQLPSAAQPMVVSLAGGAVF